MVPLIQGKFSLDLLDNNFYLGENASIKECSFGLHTTVGDGCNVFYADVGSYCSISWNVNIGVIFSTIDY
jgi:hypothetical protein